MNRGWLNSLLAYPPSAATAIRKVEPGERKVDRRCFVSACRSRILPLVDLPGGVSANTEGGRKAFGRRWRRTEGDRKVFAAGEPASRTQSPGDKRLKPTAEGVPKAVGRWAAGTEGGAKAPACDGKPISSRG
jgi:hypothetical protein